MSIGTELKQLVRDTLFGRGAIGNLDCLWGVTCRPLSIGRTPVACQDLNTGMCFEPTGDQMIAPPDLLVVASATGLV